MPDLGIGRTIVYTAIGFSTEVAFSALHDAGRGRKVRMRTSPWMLPIYALIRPLYEPLHDRMRGMPVPARATVYGLGFMTIEYASGRALRALRGHAPWDYSYARRHLDGLVRLDYFPLWATGGLALESLHDRLVGRTHSG
ncbi:MAG: hypothetical protein M3198_13935 [Actinomycetota bacterium]|nr:hypothetical protein [Actinomycetota bacterium]